MGHRRQHRPAATLGKPRLRHGSPGPAGGEASSRAAGGADRSTGACCEHALAARIHQLHVLPLLATLVHATTVVPRHQVRTAVQLSVAITPRQAALISPGVQETRQAGCDLQCCSNAVHSRTALHLAMRVHEGRRAYAAHHRSVRALGGACQGLHLEALLLLALAGVQGGSLEGACERSAGKPANDQRRKLSVSVVRCGSDQCTQQPQPQPPQPQAQAQPQPQRHTVNVRWRLELEADLDVTAQASVLVTAPGEHSTAAVDRSTVPGTTRYCLHQDA